MLESWFGCLNNTDRASPETSTRHTRSENAFNFARDFYHYIQLNMLSFLERKLMKAMQKFGWSIQDGQADLMVLAAGSNYPIREA